MERAEQVHAHDAVERLDGVRPAPAGGLLGPADARAHDRDAELPAAPARGGHRELQLRGIRHVARDERRADLRGQRVAGRGVDVGHADVGAGGAQPPRGRGAQAGRAAGDERPRSFDPHGSDPRRAAQAAGSPARPPRSPPPSGRRPPRVVDQFETEMRIAARPVASGVPPSQHVPSSCTRRDHRVRGGVVVPNAHEHLVEHHLVEHRDAGLGRQPLGDPGGQRGSSARRARRRRRARGGAAPPRPGRRARGARPRAPSRRRCARARRRPVQVRRGERHRRRVAPPGRRTKANAQS